MVSKVAEGQEVVAELVAKEMGKEGKDQSEEVMGKMRKQISNAS